MDSTSAIAVLTAMIALAVLISACGSLGLFIATSVAIGIIPGNGTSRGATQTTLRSLQKT